MNSLTAASDVKQRGQRPLPRFGRDSDRAFRAAVRHSRYIRILRIMVPGGVVAALVGGIVFTAVIKPLSMLSGVPVDIGSLVVSGTKIMMQQPRLAGFTRDNRRYDMVAQAAAQDLTKPDVVEPTAKTGFYNSKTEQLTLSQNIVVTSSSGYQAFLSEAVLDVRASKVVSDKPVQVRTASWTIDANRMEVNDAGELMRFDRGVFVSLLLDGAVPVAQTPVAQAQVRGK
jgi:lipopolysaccharide export system protein LptC